MPPAPAGTLASRAASAGGRAEIVLPAAELSLTVAFFVETLGFRLDRIAPADRPETATISGHGLRIRLEPGPHTSPGIIRIRCRDAGWFGADESPLTAPNGTRVELVGEDPPLFVPPVLPAFQVSTGRDQASWQPGRAGMRYRDLVPDRLGGSFIASHIAIPEGGPVPDYVHYHQVRFQAIYCYKGWVRVVYEDQGEPFVLEPGDCVLQPPRIRHRVLESSPGLEVIEVACPARHETLADHDLVLPGPVPHPRRQFDGQRFVRHQARRATSSRWRIGGFRSRDTGIGAATAGLATVQIARRSGTIPPDGRPCHHDAAILLLFILVGDLRLGVEGQDHRLSAGDCTVIPSGTEYAFRECSENLEILEVGTPAAFATTFHEG